MKNKVHFKPASNFAVEAEKVFNQVQARIIQTIPNADVQHIGSTAIPGSITKGDLDVNVRVKREDFVKAVNLLKVMCEINQPENWTAEFASFKDDSSFAIDLGVQLVVIDSKTDDFVKIRDLLRKRPDLVQKCNEMKVRFEGKNMDDYRKAKVEFFENLRKLLR